MSTYNLSKILLVTAIICSVITNFIGAKIHGYLVLVSLISSFIQGAAIFSLILSVRKLRRLEQRRDLRSDCCNFELVGNAAATWGELGFLCLKCGKFCEYKT